MTQTCLRQYDPLSVTPALSLFENGGHTMKPHILNPQQQQQLAAQVYCAHGKNGP